MPDFVPPTSAAKIFAQKCYAFRQASGNLYAAIDQHSQQLDAAVAAATAQSAHGSQLRRFRFEREHAEMVVGQIGKFERRLAELATFNDMHNFTRTYRLATAYVRSVELLLLRSYHESGVPLPSGGAIPRFPMHLPTPAGRTPDFHIPVPAVRRQLDLESSSNVHGPSLQPDDLTASPRVPEIRLKPPTPTNTPQQQRHPVGNTNARRPHMADHLLRTPSLPIRRRLNMTPSPADIRVHRDSSRDFHLSNESTPDFDTTTGSFGFQLSNASETPVDTTVRRRPMTLTPQRNNQQFESTQMDTPLMRPSDVEMSANLSSIPRPRSISRDRISAEDFNLSSVSTPGYNTTQFSTDNRQSRAANASSVRRTRPSPAASPSHNTPIPQQSKKQPFTFERTASRMGTTRSGSTLPTPVLPVRRRLNVTTPPRVAVHRKHQTTANERAEWQNFYQQIFAHVGRANRRLCRLYHRQHDSVNAKDCTAVLRRFEQMLAAADRNIGAAMQTDDESLIAATVFANIRRLEADASLLVRDVRDPAVAAVRVQVVALPQNITAAMVEQADHAQS